MKQMLLMLSMLLVVTTSNCKDNKQELGEIQIVTPVEMITLLHDDEVQLIDVRTPEEVDEGFIANSQNIDFFSSSFSTDIGKLDKTKPVILYCRSGKRSEKSAQILKESGFKKIYDLDGGFIRWKDEGFEVTTHK